MNGRKENDKKTLINESRKNDSKDKGAVREAREKHTKFYSKLEAQVNRTMGRSRNKKYGY